MAWTTGLMFMLLIWLGIKQALKKMAWHWYWKCFSEFLKIPPVHMHRACRFRRLKGKWRTSSNAAWPGIIHEIIQTFMYSRSKWPSDFSPCCCKVRNLNRLKEFQKFFFLILGSDCLGFLYLYCNNFKSTPLENKCSKAYYQTNFCCPIYISQISVQAIKDFHILWIQLKFKHLPHR